MRPRQSQTPAQGCCGTGAGGLVGTAAKRQQGWDEEAPRPRAKGSASAAERGRAGHSSTAKEEGRITRAQPGGHLTVAVSDLRTWRASVAASPCGTASRSRTPCGAYCPASCTSSDLIGCSKCRWGLGQSAEACNSCSRHPQRWTCRGAAHWGGLTCAHNPRTQRPARRSP